MFLLEHTFDDNEDSAGTLDWPGGVGTLFGVGTFDTGTLKAQFSIDEGTTFADVSTEGADIADLTQDGVIDFQLAPCLLKMNFAGGAGSENVKGRIGLAEFG